MILQEIKEKIESIDQSNTLLYFITRYLKEGVNASSRMLDKYEFKVYQIDIDSDIRRHLHESVINQYEYFIKRKEDIIDYNVISDDTSAILTYSLENKVMSFKDVVENQLSNSPERIQSLDGILQNEELWAYAVGLYTSDSEWIYNFKKVMNGKVAITEGDSKKHNILKRSIRARFNSSSEKLELIKGETIFLDKQVDCFYYNDIFYVFRKTKFEQIIGLVEEFKEQSLTVVNELVQTGMIKGLDLIAGQIENKPSIHKKLVRIQKIGNYRELTLDVLFKMQSVCKKYGDTLKVVEGKIQIEDEKDIDLTLKMLSDYYKTGEVSGKAYGTYSGKQLNPNSGSA